MKILIHDYAGHPFQVQLSRQLAKRGHAVMHLYAGDNNTPKGPLTLQSDDPPTFSVEPISLRRPLDKYNFVKRWLQEREYGRKLSAVIREFAPDVMLSANTPLDAQKAALLTAENQGVAFAFWLQDMIGEAARRLLRRRLAVVGDWIGRYYISLERLLLKKSAHIVSITPDFVPILQNWGVPPSRISVIPNWAPLQDLPVRPKDNPWAKTHDLHEKFCFVYTGTLGMKHNPALLLQLALHYRKDPDVRVVVISEGIGAQWLREKKARYRLSNLLLMGYQPFQEVPNVMGAADVLIAILEPDAGIFSVPSKVLSYLCARRPILAAMPRENLAAKIIEQEQAGVVVPPDNLEAFVAAAEMLRNSEEKRVAFGMQGRQYAERYFDIEEITAQFERIFEMIR